MRIFCAWCEREHVDPILASTNDLLRFVSFQINTLQRTTAMNRVFGLRSFYQYLIRIGWRGDNPTAPIPVIRGEALPVEPFSATDLSRLLNAADCIRDRAILLFALGSLCRRAEMAGIKIEDVDWAEGTVRIRKGKGNRQRIVAPGRSAMTLLRKYVDHRTHGPLWLRSDGVTPMSGQDFWRVVAQLGKRAGVIGAYPHRLRVTGECWLLEAGADAISVASVAGHSLKMVRYYQRAVETKRALSQQRKYSLANRLGAG